MSNEYPRCLYLGGDTKKGYKLVADAEAEKAAAGDGFYRAGAGPKKADEPKPAGDPIPGDAEPPKRKPGRPKKVT